MSDAEARQAWRDLLPKSAEIANAVREGAHIDREARAIFAGAVIRAPKFPVGHVSAQAAAEAFLILARNFVSAGMPAQSAAFLAAGAACLDVILTEDGHARAAAGRRMLGEGD